jgi:ATPase subunit of ABC transporter with duplicated ATPase domains
MAKKQITSHKDNLSAKLNALRPPQIISHKFSLKPDEVKDELLISIRNGTTGYDKPLLTNINLTLLGGQRLAITGDNGTGKSTLLKAILGEVPRSGEWFVPKPQDIGYLDQHYSNLAPSLSVFATISQSTNLSHDEVRRHLNDFLFRTQEQVYGLSSTLSGGERALLSLAQIAAKTPKLLLLDELTNNLDLSTRKHVITALKNYPGALIVISHDVAFLKELRIDYTFVTNKTAL